MTKIFKRPLSIILAVLMIVSLFTIVPVTASAAVGDYVAQNEFLTFTAVEAKSSVTLNVSTGSNLQYNKNNSDWQSYTVGSLIALENGETVRFRGKDTTFNNSKHVSIGGKVMCRGNVMSLRLDEESRDQGLSDSCFQYMFKDCTGLKTAPELPETTLANRCYYGMFSGCRSLIKAHDLPATALANNCYGYMFENCEDLIVAPELPATSLEYGCYSYMFSGCTNLTTAPELPATTLAGNCYRNMFSGCTSLTTAPELPAEELESNCYSYMFNGCSSLTTAPELPATALASNCYNSMFSGCTSLTTAPELPATTLESYCYNAMFFGCSSIKLSETQTAEYSIPYSVPSGGNGTTASAALNSMFAGTGGTFTGTPEINKTYYMYREVPKYTVTWKNGDTTLETDADVESGATPSYDGEIPTKDGVTFVGWTDSHGVFYAKDATLPEVTADETYTAVFELTIGSVDEWNSFAASVKGGNTYSGIIVRMTADVGPVTTMVDGTFSGTFDGDGHTLTVNISGGSTSVATFAYVKDATIQNLRLEGTVTSSGIHTAALVKSVSDTGSTCTIKNVDIYADVNCSNNYIGGFIGHAGTANTVNIENSIFAGSINKTGSTQGNFIGAFIGWSQTLTATINNCAFTGSYNNIKSFNNIGFSYNAPTKVTVSGFYSNASEVFVANVNHGTRLYVPSSSYPTTVALVKNNDGETFYSAFSDALAAWTDGSTLALLADVTCDSLITVPAADTKTLDLNGNALSLSYSSTKVEVNGTLTIQSTASGGSITPTTKSRVINVVDGGTLNIESGTIHGYNADRAVIGGVGTINLNGGKIVTPASNAFSPDGVATLNLNGGEIECTSGSTSMGTATAVWAHGDSTINWNGTAITTNTGDGIRMKSAGNGTVNVTGGSFTATSSSLPEEGGYAIYCNSNMGTLNLEGNPSISGRGIYLTNDKVINITDELSNTNPISVTMQTPGVFTSGLSGNGDASNFANGNGTGYALTLNASGEAQIVSTYTVTWKNGDTVLETDTDVEIGAAPSFDGAEPTKAADNNKHYTFSGWSDGTNTYAANALPEVSSDVIYTAQFTGTSHTWDTANAVWDDAPTAYVDDYYEDAYKANVTVICSDCGKERTFEANTEDRMGAIQEHSATCDTDGYTQVTVFATVGSTEISKVYQLDVVPAAHDTTHVVAKAATFEADGNIEYWRCGICGKYFSDENCENEITQAQTIIPQKVAVAQIGSTKYESLSEAITAAEDGDTITVLADTTVPCYFTQIDGKDITIDATGYTVTGTGYTTFPMFNVKATGGLTLAGGTFSNPGGIISNNGTAVVNGATLTAGGFAIQNKGNLTINSGTITATESAVTNGGTTAKTTITGGTFTGKIKPANDGDGSIAISGGTFDRDVDIYAAPGYVGKQLSATTFGVEVDTNPLGTAPIIGFQKKAADAENAQGVRIVTKVGGCDLTQFDEYGYVVAKVSGKEQATANFNNLKAYGGNGEKTIKCNDTVNTIDGLGTPYVTLAVNGMTDGQQVAARFYAIKDGVTYYSNYVSTARYNGIIAAY